jgi:hypothetical protein
MTFNVLFQHSPKGTIENQENLHDIRNLEGSPTVIPPDSKATTAKLTFLVRGMMFTM